MLIVQQKMEKIYFGKVKILNQWSKLVVLQILKYRFVDIKESKK